MKKRWFSLSLFCASALVFTLTGCSPKFTVPAIEDVQAAELSPGHGGAGGTTIPLHLNDQKDKATVAKILGWLRDGRSVGEAKDQFISMGGSPTVLVLHLRDGDSLSIEDAIGSTSSHLPNGNTLLQSQGVPNQVTVFEAKDHQPLRIIAPDLKNWIEQGWKQDLPASNN